GSEAAVEEVAGDDEALDLVRSFEDLTDPCVPVRPLDRRPANVAEPPVDLQGLVNDLARPFGGETLHRRRLAGLDLPLEAPPAGRVAAHAVLTRGRVVDHQSQCVDLHRHIRELELDHLVLRDRMAELGPVLGEIERGCRGGLHPPRDAAPSETRPTSSAVIATRNPRPTP